jgi:hypothetical protein
MYIYALISTHFFIILEIDFFFFLKTNQKYYLIPISCFISILIVVIVCKQKFIQNMNQIFNN